MQRGRSPLAGRLGERVAGEAFVLHDDGLDPAGFAASPFDGEGVPRRRTALIEGGMLRSYLYDTYTARRGDAASTGNAGRSGYRAPPSVAASNLVVAPARSASRAARARPARASTSPTSPGCTRASTRSRASSRSAPRAGDRGGELGEPLREFTIASDLISMLGAVRAAGAEPRWVPFGGSVSAPPLLIGEMTVSGS